VTLKIADEALAKSNASQAALKRLQDIQAKLARGETLTAEEYALIGVTPPSSTSSSDTQPGKAWVKGADGKWVKPAMPNDGKTYSWDDNAGWTLSKGGDTPTVTEVSRITNADGSTTVTYSDGTKKVFPKIGGGPDALDIKLISTYVDDATGDTYALYSDGSRELLSKGTKALDAAAEERRIAEEKRRQGQSAYDLLYSQFKLYGLESLVEPLKGLITSGASPAEFTIKLRETPAYQKRFAANAKRIANGFAAIDEATYLDLEDKYQSIMQNYGLPPSYYAKGEMGIQAGFEDLIAGNVDPVTLEERIIEGQKILKGSSRNLEAIKNFYPDLNDGDILGYILNPKNALSDIKRKVSAAEIGGAQLGAGLAATAAGAEALVASGVTGQRYQQAAPMIEQAATRGGQLAAMYNQTPYTQQTAEQAILNIPGSTEALKQTDKLTALEKASFAKKSGVGILSRERAGTL